MYVFEIGKVFAILLCKFFSGKWFNYGIIFLVMLLDLNMWKNQIFYNPSDYAQYYDNLTGMFRYTK